MAIMENVHYSLIYKFFTSHISFGYYKTGDFLPSIEELSQIYRTTPRTIRSAYLQLQKEGYISLSSGRKTTVICEIPADICAKNVKAYYLSRKAAIDELDQALQILFVPLLKEGCRRLEKQELKHITEVSNRVKNGEFYLHFLCSQAMILPLNNRLALDLLSEAASFYQYPHPLFRNESGSQEASLFNTLSSQIREICGRYDQESFYKSYMHLQGFMNAFLHTYIASIEPEEPAQGQSPFQWNVYRDRPQRCYSLAAQIIHQIYITHEYAPGDSLPTYGAMAASFSVSFSTIRRTADLLEKLGIIFSHQGVGANVVSPVPDPEKLKDTAVQKILRMSLEAMQILRFSFDNILAYAYPMFSHKSGNDMECPFTGEGSSPFAVCLACFDSLFSVSTNSALANIWEKLYEILLLSLPILDGQASGYSGHLELCLGKLGHSLRCQDAGEFHDALWALAVSVSSALESVIGPVL